MLKAVGEKLLMHLSSPVGDGNNEWASGSCAVMATTINVMSATS